MKVDELNYNISKLQLRAKILSDYLSEMFFDEFDEFDTIVIEYEYKNSKASFYVCFDSISNDVIKNLKKFNKFIGLDCDDLTIKSKNFNRKDEPMVYVEFNSNEPFINNTIHRIEMMNNKKIKVV